MKQPKVLLLGYNYASVMNSLAEGFRQTGVPCRALSFELHRSQFNNYNHVECVYPSEFKSRVVVNWFRLRGLVRLMRYLAWCDVLHIFCDTPITGSRLELQLFRRLRKKKFINFLGSEVRNPDVSLRINPY